MRHDLTETERHFRDELTFTKEYRRVFNDALKTYGPNPDNPYLFVSGSGCEHWPDYVRSELRQLNASVNSSFESAMQCKPSTVTQKKIKLRKKLMQEFELL